MYTSIHYTLVKKRLRENIINVNGGGGVRQNKFRSGCRNG
jgi:hypothetical protein